MIDTRLGAVGPADLHFLDFGIPAQPEMRQRRVERTVTATGLDLPHLVPLAFRPIMYCHAAPDAEPVAPAIP